MDAPTDSGSAPVEPRRRSWRWLKITLVVLAGIALLLVLTYREWLPRVIVGYGLIAMPEREFGPVSDIVLSEPPPSGLRYEHQGVSLTVPWTDFHSYRATSTLAVRFGSTTEDVRTIALFYDDLHMKRLIETPKEHAFYGGTLTTNYDVYRALHEVSREDVNLLAPPAEFMPTFILLMLKNVTLVTLPAYRFENMHGIRGYLYQNSATSSMSKFFTPTDRDFTLIIGGATQAERDAILQSIQEL
ncbi:MAG TPA: hypothetical protein VEA36_03140 [Candidatus Paceibacterota bacterium]|nr:hypothetical protein [Candidatus Paceibacterota bacterium]